jgi:release factor glutamine methyltransferase
MNLNTLPLPNNMQLEYYTDSEVFKPTGTTDLLIAAAKSQIIEKGKILDLGCGSGIVGLSVAKLLPNFIDFIFASDISENSSNITKKNAKHNQVEIDARFGDCFQPWKGMKFNYIIDDVSGVSEEVAKISPWFSNTSCSAGKNGTSLTCRIIKESVAHLEDGGALIFPIISLSKTSEILECAREHYSNVVELNSATWPLPKEMSSHIELLNKLKSDGTISFKKEFGMITWTTSIFVATNPRL